MQTRVRSGQIRVAIIVLLGFVAVSMAACGSESGTQDTNGADVTVVSHLRDRYHASAGARPFNSLDDLLDNVRYSMPGRQTRPLTDAVVTGSVTDVARGMGFYVEGNDGPSGIETDFEDPRVEWRTVHLTVAVDRVLSGTAGSEITVGFAFGNAISFDQIQKDFMSYERVLLFLQQGQPVFDYDASVYGTLMDGALLGLVDSEGSISLPVLEGDGATELMRNSRSIDALARAQKARSRQIELDASGVVVGGQLD